jgi:hypothetical protein
VPLFYFNKSETWPGIFYLLLLSYEHVLLLTIPMTREKTLDLIRSIICLVLIFTPVTARSQGQIKISQIQGEFRFDGNVDDECWKASTPLPMVMHTPTFGNQPSEKSEVMICYDNAYLYVGARLYDSNPSEMLISSKKRDEAEVVSEELMLIFDSFNDKENGLGFATTPTGLRNDFTIAKDAMVWKAAPGEVLLTRAGIHSGM